MGEQFDLDKFVGGLQAKTEKWKAMEPLKVVDRECCASMKSLTRMIGPAYDAGLRDELVAVKEALEKLHAAMMAKAHWLEASEAGTRRPA